MDIFCQIEKSTTKVLYREASKREIVGSTRSLDWGEGWRRDESIIFLKMLSYLLTLNSSDKMYII